MSRGRRALSAGQAGRGFVLVGLVLVAHLVLQEAVDLFRTVEAPPGAAGVGPDSWLAYVEHHLVQLLLALLIIVVLSRGRVHRLGLTLANAGESWRLLTHGFFPVLLVSLLAGHTLVPVLTGRPPDRFADGLPQPADLAGMLLFTLVLVGVSEEVLFRGLFHTLLARGWSGSVVVLGTRVPVAAFWSAAVFTLAHVGMSLSPLRVTHVDVPQLVLAFVLGVFYAVAYERTGSLLAPVLAHNAVDGGIVLADLLAASLV